MFPLFTGQENSNPEVLGTTRSHLQPAGLANVIEILFPRLECETV